MRRKTFITRTCAGCDKSFETNNKRTKNYICSKECLIIFRRVSKTKEKITKPCFICGVPVSKNPCHADEKFMCSKECAYKNQVIVQSALCRERNKTLMTPEVREKLRNIKLNTGEGKTYTKTYSRHTHRIVAEKKLGRDLLPGEIVHHIDGDKRNNHPDNLHVYANQAEHAKHHMEVKFGRKDKFDI